MITTTASAARASARQSTEPVRPLVTLFLYALPLLVRQFRLHRSAFSEGSEFEAHAHPRERHRPAETVPHRRHAQTEGGVGTIGDQRAQPGPVEGQEIAPLG